MVAKRDDSHEATSQAQRHLGWVLVNDICESRIQNVTERRHCQ
jgi:hypothetical protein